MLRNLDNRPKPSKKDEINKRYFIVWYTAWSSSKGRQIVGHTSIIVKSGEFLSMKETIIGIKNSNKNLNLTQLVITNFQEISEVEFERWNEPFEKKEMTRNERIIQKSKQEGFPVIVLSAKDEISLITLANYYSICQKAGCDEDFLEKVNEKIIEFRDWQEANPDKVKLPD